MTAVPAARIDPASKLRHMLLTVVFCVGVAGAQYAFMPGRPFAPPLLFSLCIGLSTWAIVDIGRHFFPSARETGWPAGLEALGLVAAGIVAGYLIGTHLADVLCTTFGLDRGPTPLDRGAELRTSLLITALASAAGIYWFYSLNRGRYLERKMREAQQHASEARLKLLEAQLEPHMLFNTLANLRALIGADPPRAQQMLDHMIDYLRATLSASRATTHPLQQEFDRVRDYLALMAIRMGPRLTYTLDLPPALAAHPVPTLLLQPLVENAIRHGLEGTVAGGSITVRASVEGGALRIDVADTGAGADGTVSPRGFGLAQVRERLAALHGAAATLTVDGAPGAGTRATVRLPLAPA